MLSRHRSACVNVGREGIGDALKRHQHDWAEGPLGSDDAEWPRWSAHARVWSELSRIGRIMRVDF